MDETPSTRSEEVEVVGLGASAGGLESLTKFFAALPPAPGLAFVVVTHLHSDHVSYLPELLARHTALEVVQVHDRQVIAPDHVYVAAPGTVLELAGGELRDTSASVGATRERAFHPIDALFRSFALERREHAIVAILSGAGTDGTDGARAVNRAGGLVLVEDPNEATHDGMPRSAIDAGVADRVEPVAALVRLALAFAAHGRVEGLGDDLPSHQVAELLGLVRRHTGHDFSAYKTTTLQRRLARRMRLRQFGKPEDYLRHLRRNPQEIDAVFTELLIGVTSFFRDPEAFEALETHLRARLGRKQDGESFRAWVLGCSTGEEAYSVAMLLRELTAELACRVELQIFATDVNPAAIDVARAGVYSEHIRAELAPARLERCFHREDDGYHVRKEIRDSVVFAPHSVLRDPPFTKLDLLVCRNVLIYLVAASQRLLLPAFHYALRPGGLLFLGSSESVGGAAALFETLDKKWKIYASRAVTPAVRPQIPLGMSPPHAGSQAGGAAATGSPIVRLKPKDIDKLLLREYVPPTVIVDELGTILHIHGRTGLYLEPAPGQPNLNLLAMSREGLQPALASCLQEAKTSAAEVRQRDVQVRSNGDYSFVEVHVRRVQEPLALRGLFLVSFHAQPHAPSERVTEELSVADQGRLELIAHELRYTKETLQSTIEELETSNEELRSTNEEMQSTNEELQSLNEELETSKEEMQSLNEELQTVNNELEDKVVELSQANDDMTNLLNSTDIATVFLDRDLNVKRFTQSATRVIKLIQTDIGRPIGDLASELDYESLVDDAREVFRTLRHKERQLRGKNGGCFLMRMVPYRTTENVIDGLVLTFVDISEQERSSAALGLAEVDVRRSDDAVRRILELAPVRIVAGRVDVELRYTWVVNALGGARLDDVIGTRVDRVHQGEGGRGLLELLQRVLAERANEREDLRFETQRGAQSFRVSAEPLFASKGGEPEGASFVMVELPTLE